MAEEEGTLSVRLRPWKKNKYGHRVKSYRIFGQAFKLDKWYIVSEAVGYHLKAITEDPYDDESPKIFQVLTHAEAEALEEREREKEMESHRRTRRAKRVITTLDTALPSEQEPVAGYGAMNVTTILVALREMRGEQLEQALIYELGHKKRATVKREIMRRLSRE